MRIQNNIMAMNTHRQYNINNSAIAKSTEKLSSGYRINRAGDDAAGLAISEKMRAQIRGLTMASKNSQDAISLVQTAEGALQETHNILQRMRELAVQSSSDTNEQTIDRAALQQEFQALKDEIDDIASKTRFNDQNLIDGTFQQYKKTLNAASTTFASNGVMSIMTDRAAAGTHTVTVTVNNPVASTTITGVAVTGKTASSTLLATFAGTAPTNAAGGVNNMAGTKLAFAGALTGEHNNNIYTMQASGANAENMTFQLMDSNNNLVAEIKNVDMTDWSASHTKSLSFAGVGTFTITKNANTTISKDATGANAVIAAFSNKTLEFNNDGAAPVVNPAKPGSIDLEISGEKVSLGLGDTRAVFNSVGIELSFSAITDVDMAAAGKFTAGGIVVDQSKGQTMVIQSGANEGDELSINIDAMNTRMLGIATADISTRTNASSAITEVNNAINQVSTQRAALGALQNRLDHKIANLDTSAENLTAAESRIRDVDMAKEMTTFTKNNILFQASMAMLAQANAAPQGVLQLLG